MWHIVSYRSGPGFFASCYSSNLPIIHPCRYTLVVTLFDFVLSFRYDWCDQFIVYKKYFSNIYRQTFFPMKICMKWNSSAYTQKKKVGQNETSEYQISCFWLFKRRGDSLVRVSLKQNECEIDIASLYFLFTALLMNLQMYLLDK